MVSNKIKNATHAFLQKYHREPSAEELSDIISLEIDKIEKAIQAESHVASIDAPITEDEGSTMADVLASSSDYATDLKVDYDSMCSDLMEVLTSILSERERIIVTQSFGIGCPERGMDAIGSDLGLTRERVRQIRERGLDKVRMSPKSRKLLKHLGA
jgi:RNA polymerase primary sigma factor